MNVNAPEAGTWIKSLGDVFLGLNTSAIIRRVIGVIEILPDLQIKQIQGLSWQEFIRQYADESAQEGLRHAWLAMSERRVAPAYWPSYLPFKSDIIARLRPVDDDPIVAFAVHLSRYSQYDLNTTISNQLLETADRLTRLIRRLYSGVNGPLTDLQIKDVSRILNHAECAHQLLEDLRASMLAPATVAPHPLPLERLLTFSESDFASRRFQTHRLSLNYRCTPLTVYCQPTIREMVKRLLHTLIAGITAQSAITVATAANTDEHVAQIEITYHSPVPDLVVKEAIDPTPLNAPERLQPKRTIEQLVNTAHAHLTPVNGRARAEPRPGDAACIVLILPIWKADN